MKLQPLVRVILTAIAAGLAVLMATVDDETIRIVAGALVAVLASIGIIPPQLPTATVVSPVTSPTPVTPDVDELAPAGEDPSA